MAGMGFGFPIRCCRNCEDRYSGCHGICQTYLDEAAKRDRAAQARLQESEQTYDLVSRNMERGARRMTRELRDARRKR